MAPGLEKFQSANWALRVSWAVVEPRSGKFPNPFPAQPLLEGYGYSLKPTHRGPLYSPIGQAYMVGLYGPMPKGGPLKWLYLAYLSQASKGTVG